MRKPLSYLSALIRQRGGDTRRADNRGFSLRQSGPAPSRSAINPAAEREPGMLAKGPHGSPAHPPHLRFSEDALFGGKTAEQGKTVKREYTCSINIRFA